MRAMLVFFDWVTVFSGLMIAHEVSNWTKLFEVRNLPPLGFEEVAMYGAISAGLAVIIMLWQGAYNPNLNHMRLDGDRRFIRSLTMVMMVIFPPFLFAQDHADTRELLTLAIFIVPALLMFQKTLFVAFLSQHYDKPVRTRKLLILGAHNQGPYVLRQALSCWDPGYLPVGFLSREPVENGDYIETESRGLVGSVPVLGEYSQLEHFMKRHAITEIWLNDPQMSQEDIVFILRLCENRGVVVSMLPSIGRIPTMSVIATHAGGQVLLRERIAPERIYYDRVKRFADFVASGMMIIGFSPILLLIAIWVKLDSKGPIFFTQERIGKNGKPFMMYKFRSMNVNAPKYAVSPDTKFDPRITRSGRFLRKTSLDELGQLINVFKGEMSLVGPRPEMSFIVKKYNRFQRARLQVSPGITGLWQISADRSIAIHDNLDYDLYYIQNRSLTTDMVILWRTVWFAIRGV
ncbi:UDP-glucose:undecaprenyl-phosphate glucose-1-phosphate transferase [bacterium BMS3Bbin04]|nr:UDP-glucose:undecaprenyl-phosphate glucose-1-phosphate transferase [bacterium BMS3Bbin04]